jgi:RNA polymerase sigma factor (sigma-70 family)
MSISIATIPNLEALIEGCRRSDRRSQELLYKQFYGYAMGVCMRYTRTRDEAIEVLNDGFMKVFNHADKIDVNQSFKNWLRRVMVNTALDYYRSQHKHYYHDDIETAYHVGQEERITSDISHEELIKMVQELSPAYRTVFNLYVIDGFNHEEIAQKLGISVGTSKSNLARARVNLREMLAQREI